MSDYILDKENAEYDITDATNEKILADNAVAKA
jgi:hypothetical protein